MAVVVPIVTEYNGKGLNSAIKEIGQAEGALGKLSAAGKVLGATFAAAGASFVVFQGARFIGDSIKAAADLGESLSKTRVIFGESAREIERFSETAALALGQTRQQALDAASTFAVFGKAANLTGPELVNFSTRLTSLASDLSSFYNTNPADAITALGAALRGENEPIRRYGVMINEAALQQKALELGIIGSLGPLTQQQKTLAAYELIFDQTKDAQGDFTRTQDGLANSTRTLQAAFENAKAAIGEGFVVAIEGASEAVGGPQGLAKIIEDTGKEIGFINIATGELIGTTGKYVGKLQDVGQETDNASESTSGLISFLSKGLPPQIRNLIDLWGLYGKSVQYADNAQRALAGMGAPNGRNIREIERQTDAAQALIELQRAQDAYINNPFNDIRADRDLLARIDMYEKAQERLNEVQDAGSGASGAVSKLSDASDKAQAKFDKLADRVRKTATALSDAKDEVKAAWQAFNAYSDEKASWVTGNVSLAAAIESQISQTKRLADLDRAITEAFNAGEWEQAAKFQAQRAGETAAVNWVDGFRKQIGDAKSATAAINELMASLNPADTVGNKALLDALTTLPPGEAAYAARDLVQRGLGPSIAAELSSLQVFAGGVGDSWAAQFYSEGIDAADQQVKGIQNELERRLADLYRQGRRMGKAVKDGYLSVVSSLPANVRGGGFDSGALGAGPVNITVNAGHGDPVAIARSIDRTLRTASIRTGRR